MLSAEVAISPAARALYASVHSVGVQPLENPEVPLVRRVALPLVSVHPGVVLAVVAPLAEPVVQSYVT